MYTDILSFEKSDISNLYGLLKKEHKVSTWVYYLDIFISAFIFWVCIITNSLLINFGILNIILIFIGSLSAFRCACFLHEICHLTKNLKGVRLFYSIVFGYWNLMPSYAFYTHMYHHNRASFGTIKDPEYGNYPSNLPKTYLSIFLFTFLIPLIALLRHFIFPLLSPFLTNKVRSFIWVHFSTMGSNPQFKRTVPSKHEKRIWIFEDLGCLLFFSILMILFMVDVINIEYFLTLYLINYCGLIMNFFRALFSHLYEADGKVNSLETQILDSCNFENNLLAVFFPVGLRFHALHHLFPNIPYHNLAKAHKLIKQTLPKDHPYFKTIKPSVVSVFLKQWKFYFKNKSIASKGYFQNKGCDTKN